jgi:hypothetical protein
VEKNTISDMAPHIIKYNMLSKNAGFPDTTDSMLSQLAK